MTGKRCQAEIMKRDTYRYTGGGSSGFEMHYYEEQCSFKAVGKKKNRYREELYLCRQHTKVLERGRYNVRKYGE